MSDISVISEKINKLTSQLNDTNVKSSPSSPITTRKKFNFKSSDIIKKSTSENNVNAIKEPQETVNEDQNVKRNSKSEDCLVDLEKPASSKVNLSNGNSNAVDGKKNPVDDIFTKALKDRLGLKTDVAIPGRVMVLNNGTEGTPMADGGAGDGGGLIAPKRLINPCLESTPRQDLHRELLFNQKIGKNVLNQKSELQKALSKHKEKRIISQVKDNKETPELERAIQERAKRLEEALNNKNESEKLEAACNLQYIEARAKLRHAK